MISDYMYSCIFKYNFYTYIWHDNEYVSMCVLVANCAVCYWQAYFTISNVSI